MNKLNPVFSIPPRLMSQQDFVAHFGGVYEHSPWVTSDAWLQGFDESHDTLDGLADALAAVVNKANDRLKLNLINLHPDLAGKAAVAGQLTADSSTEQASAGIDQCTDVEFEQFQTLNNRYKEKFGFTFVMAVKNSNRHAILEAFEERLQNNASAEFKRAIAEIHKIVKLRLTQLIQTTDNNSDSDGQLGEHDSPFSQYVDLAQPRLGSAVVYATDDFFADKSRLISPAEPIFVPNKFDDHGQWMDGWESRRKRTTGHDYCVLKLGVPGQIVGVDIDTSHFTGNYAPAAALEACVSDAEIPDDEHVWEHILDRSSLKGDSHNFFAIRSAKQFTHVRLHIYPDGGVARLRVYGSIKPNWEQFDRSELIDLVALEHGGTAVCCNDEHYGSMHNLIAPGRGVNMGDGWETARRRGPGHDWVILRLGHSGHVNTIEIDTAHFKGNYPDRVCVQGAFTTTSDRSALEHESVNWQTLLPEVKLSMDKQHGFSEEVVDIGTITHVRMSIFPDGGISRIRLYGKLQDK